MTESRSQGPRSLRLEFRAVIATYLFAALLPLFGGFACAGDREKAQRGQEEVEERGPSRRAPAEEPS